MEAAAALAPPGEPFELRTLPFAAFAARLSPPQQDPAAIDEATGGYLADVFAQLLACCRAFVEATTGRQGVTPQDGSLSYNMGGAPGSRPRAGALYARASQLVVPTTGAFQCSGAVSAPVPLPPLRACSLHPGLHDAGAAPPGGRRACQVGRTPRPLPITLVPGSVDWQCSLVLAQLGRETKGALAALRLVGAPGASVHQGAPLCCAAATQWLLRAASLCGAGKSRST